MGYLCRSTVLIGTLCLALIACSDGSDTSLPQALSFEATGFFRVEKDNTRWWLVDPQGKPFYSVGLNHIDSRGYTDAKTGGCPYCESIKRKYGDAQQWRNITVDRLGETIAWRKHPSSA
jgi:hypothetical protein